MKVGLFIPCYVDALFPQVGTATLKLLRWLGVDVTYPAGQTCCGQPMANGGFESKAVPLARKMETLFDGFDYVVAPSVSCTAFVRHHYSDLLDHECEMAGKCMDVVEFLHDVVKPTAMPGRFPHKVSIHNSCHGVRELGLSSPSEEQIPQFNKIRDLLEMVEGIEVVEPERKDECCGFGGLFCVEESAVSTRMGLDKVHRHIATGAEFITGADCSCLMHQSAIAKKNNLEIGFKHVTEILAAGL
ncbi:MAG: (Fe-S)-binding protein [Bacteroidales bacterium]|nr:(Fe-S)-binding protein [Bacteroidales bacterium]